MVPCFAPGFLHIWPHCPLPSPVPSHPPITHKSGRWSRAHEYLQQMSSYINKGCIMIRVLLFGFQANYCFLILPLRSHWSLFLQDGVVCSAAGRFFACDWLWHFLVPISVKLFPYTTQPDSPSTDWASYALANLLQPISPKNWKMRKYCRETRNHGHLSFMAGKPIYFWHSNFCLAWNIHTFIGKCQQMRSCWTKLVEIKVWSW